MNNITFVICQTDKNLGACLIERAVYITRALNDHLLDENTYTQHDEHTFNLLRIQTTKDIKSFVIRNYSKLPEHERTYLWRAYLSEKYKSKRIAQFYILPKIHKTPWKTRPVVSDSGSVTSFLSKWLDVQLQALAIRHVQTYTRDSEDLHRSIMAMSPLPKNALLFTADAVSMYTNIDPAHAKSEIKKWLLQLFQREHGDLTEIDRLLEALDLVMNNNLFAFGDTYWKQISGVAMGTPAACMLSTIYYGIHENNTLIPKYKHNIPFLKRFIDDMLGVFVIHTETDLEIWESFKHDLPFGQLRWTQSSLSTSVDFLDLTITLRKDKVLSTRTFQKKTNLYLYIPPYSAHAPGLFKSIIYSTIRRYWLQNSHWEDFKHIIESFFTRLTDRGYKEYNIRPIFKSTLEYLTETIPFQTTDRMQPMSRSEMIKKTK